MTATPRGRRLAGPLLLLAGILAIVVIAGATIGTAAISWRDVIGGSETARTIFFDIRLPRVLLAALVGVALAASGVMFQTLLRNPLADPFILGVSGGAACGAAVTTALRLARIPGVVSLVAFAGALGATAAVILLARRREFVDPTRLLIAGLVLNALFSAIILIAYALAPAADMAMAVRWMMGTLFGATWSDVALLFAVVAAGFAVLTWIAGDLRMLAFGEDDAKSRGVDVERVKLIGFGVSSVITGAAVAVSGIIGFVGLLVPHLIRLMWRRDFRVLLPLSSLGGAILLVLADLASRVAMTSAELPVGAFTAILGVPFFLSLMRRGR